MALIRLLASRQLKVRPTTTNMTLNKTWPVKLVAYVLITPALQQVLALAQHYVIFK